MGRLATSPLRYWGLPPLHSGGQNQWWITCRRIGDNTPAMWGVPNTSKRRQDKNSPKSGMIGCITQVFQGVTTLQSERQNEQWLTHRLIGYITHAIWRGYQHFSTRDKIIMDHMWADRRHQPNHLMGPRRFTAKDEIENGPQVDRWATSRLPIEASPTLQSAGQNQ